MRPDAEPTDLTHDEALIWANVRRFFRLVDRTHAFYRRHAADAGLTLTQAHVLLMLRPGQPAVMTELARDLSADLGNLSGVVTKLEEAGLAVREADAADARRRRVVLTTEGVQRREQLLRATLVGSPLAGGLTADEQHTLADLLRALLRHDAAGPTG